MHRDALAVQLELVLAYLGDVEQIVDELRLEAHVAGDEVRVLTHRLAQRLVGGHRLGQ